jgi:hypothetical protein
MPGDGERLFMEPIDTEMDYMVRAPRPRTSASRMNALLILPILGFVLILVFIAAAIFQLDLSDLIDSLMGLVTFFFLVMIVMLFWALAPRTHKS